MCTAPHSCALLVDDLEKEGLPETIHNRLVKGGLLQVNGSDWTVIDGGAWPQRGLVQVHGRDRMQVDGPPWPCSALWSVCTWRGHGSVHDHRVFLEQVNDEVVAQGPVEGSRLGGRGPCCFKRVSPGSNGGPHGTLRYCCRHSSCLMCPVARVGRPRAPCG